jgi:hypothetical protein
VHDGNVPEEPIDEELEDPDPAADDPAAVMHLRPAMHAPPAGEGAAAGDESDTQPVTPAPTP